MKKGDTVYLEDFDLFARVEKIEERRKWKTPYGKLGLATDYPVDRRTMWVDNHLVHVTALVSLTKHHTSGTYDITHCKKVTKAFMKTYTGEAIMNVLDKLACVKPDE